MTSNEDQGQEVAKTAGQDKQRATEPGVGTGPEESAAKPEEKEEKRLDVEALQQQIEKQKELAKRHLDQWKRTAADLENYHKRVEKERAELLKFGQAALITRLLPVLDDLERAFQTLPAALHTLTWVDGVTLIDRKLRLLLEQQGLKEIEALNKPFDPALHEALLQEESSAYPDGQVLAILQRGYLLHDRVLRPAMVKVAKNKKGNKTTEAEKTRSVAEEQKEQTD